MIYHGRYYPRGNVNGWGADSSDPLDSAIDFVLTVGEHCKYDGRYLGTNKKIPLEICKAIDAAIVDLLHDKRETVQSREPFVRLTKTQ